MDIHIVTGHLGSGKTEVAINFALHLQNAHQQTGIPAPIALVDVDVVNPYFAAREMRDLLERRGIAVAAPSLKLTTAAVHTLPKEVYQMLHREEYTVIVDVGGDSMGARVIGSLCEHLKGKHLQMYCVVNTKRPSTSFREGILEYIASLSAVSRLPMNGLIHNTHLLHETSVEDIWAGQHLLEQISQEVGLPIVFTTAMQPIVQKMTGIRNTVLPMERFIKPPYEL